MDEWFVWIFDLWKAEPIYHRPLPGYPLHTYCGRRPGEGMRPFPSVHAAKIGRPCKTCWPQEGKDGKRAE